jgi:dihydrofolate reductase
MLAKNDRSDKLIKNRQDLVEGGDLVDMLIQLGLIDECRFMIFPIILRDGKRLLKDGSDKKLLRLVDVRTQFQPEWLILKESI